LLWTIGVLLEIANGSNVLNKESDTFTSKFGVKSKFHQLYQFLKQHREYKWNQDLPHESCMCESCENSHLLTTAINRKIRDTSRKLPSSLKEIVEQFSCDRQNAECMLGICSNCPNVQLPQEAFKSNQAEDENDHDSTTNDTDSDTLEEITYYKWMVVNSKIQKVGIDIAIGELPSLLTEKITELKEHIYINNEQQWEYNRLKDEFKPGEFVIHVDYAESYSNTQQDKIQSTYFCHKISAYLLRCYYAREAVGAN